MPRTYREPRNPLTGRARKMPARNIPRKRRATALTVNVRDFLFGLRMQANSCMEQACLNRSMVHAILQIGYQVAIQNEGHEKLPEVLHFLGNYALVLHAHMYAQFRLWQFLTTIDAELGDVPIEDEISRPYHKERAYNFIDDFVTDDEAKFWTNFTKPEIRRLMDHFDLPHEIHVERTDGFHHTFHREELLIFTLMKMKTGETTAELVDGVVGGRSEMRMNRGYKWMVHYLDDRYAHIIGMQGLQRWVPYFPMFAEKIRENVDRNREFIDPDTGMPDHIDQGVHFPPGSFRVAGFIDCTDYRISRPRSGPAGDYYGSMRRPGWYIAQRAYYQRHKKMHGVRVLSICLPNGLSTVFGPISSRRNDLTALHMSQLPAFLEQLQQGIYPEPYAFYGDTIYRVPSRCIVTRHEPAVNAPLTHRQRQENKIMKKARVTIEWAFGLVENLFHLARHSRDAFKLENSDPQHVSRQVRVMHLLTNCCVCLRGSNISSRQTFNCPPPSLEAYLG